MDDTTQRALEISIARLEAALRRALGVQADKIISRLRGLPPDQLLVQLGDQKFMPSLRREVEAALREKLADVARLGAQDAAKELPRVRFDLPPVEAQQWASQHAAELVTQVDENTRQLLRDEIDRAMGTPGGVKMPDLKARIEAVLRDDNEYRARRIALTETVAAYHNGSLRAYYASGEVWGKRWVAGQAGMCKVCQALNGQVVRLGDPFRVTVDGEEHVVEEGRLAHPNDKCRIAPVTYSQVAERYMNPPGVQGHLYTDAARFDRVARERTGMSGYSLSGFADGDEFFLAPRVSENLTRAMRKPELFGEKYYGDTLRTWLHEQAHHARPVPVPNDLAFIDLDEGLIELAARQKWTEAVKRLGYSGPAAFYGAYSDEHDLIEFLTQRAPEHVSAWMTVDGPDLIDRIARDVAGKEKADELKAILSASMTRQDRLDQVRAWLLRQSV